MLFEDNGFDINMSLFIPDVDFNQNNNNNILTPMEGFLRGNMFKDEYEPYKSLTFYKLNISTDKEKKLYKIMALTFAITDLNLYLDLHPEDQGTFELFKNYISQKEELCKEYENIYGPLEITSTNRKYEWLNSPWPWDKRGGNEYV